MKLFYSPAYKGHYFVDFSKQSEGIAFDCEYKNSEGLVHLLATFLGVHQKDTDYQERLTKYYSAFSDYMKAHADNIFHESFSKAPLATAKECLKWRDQLALYGWTSDMPSYSKRLEVLSAVDKDFGIPGRGEFRYKVLNALKENKGVLHDSEILVAFAKDMLPPFDQMLLTMLEEGGCKVTYTDYNDAEIDISKIEVYHFKTQTESLQYLATLPDDDFNVWINGDNKLLDNWLHVSGKPVAGSTLTDASPHFLQLIVLGLSMFRKPLNVELLLEWLNLPVNPLGKMFCSRLGDAIVRSGGFCNETCKKVVQEYIDGNYTFREEKYKDLSDAEWAELLEKSRKKREANMIGYLPTLETDDIDIDNIDKNTIVEVEEIRDYINILSNWTSQRISMLDDMAETVRDDKQIAQLSSLNDTLRGLSLLLQQEKRERVEYSLVESWISSLYEPEEFLQYEAQKGCREIITNQAAIVDSARSIIWCDVYGSHEQQLSCSFLSEIEREGLSEHVCFWDKDAERKYNHAALMMPLHKATEKLVLVTCEKSGSEKLPLHPIVIWLQGKLGEDGYQKLVTMPTLPDNLYVEKPMVRNAQKDDFVRISNADKFRWPEHESASSMGNIIQYPLDYALDTLTGFRSHQVAEMQEVKRTMGNVAHAVIASLFSPQEGEETCDARTIKNRVDELYEKTFVEIVQSTGAILLQDNNLLALKQLRSELANCIKNLVEIMRDNQLAVYRCELLIEDSIVGIKSSDGVDIPMKGFVDMTLKDTNGDIVVFDFKWTSKGTTYKQYLQNDASVQLGLYAAMIKQKENLHVHRYGYFLMPEGTLYSTHAFSGKHYQQLSLLETAPNTDTPIIEKIRNAYKFRREQLENGMIEFVDECPGETGDYGKSVEELKLIPLTCNKEGRKYANSFTNYPFFEFISEMENALS